MKKRKVAIILFHDNEGNVLLQDRKDYSKYGEEFAFFGGGIEEGENPEQALRRELKEELGFEIQEFSLFKRSIRFVKEIEKEIERFLFIAPMPDIKLLKCNEGKISMLKFKDSLNLKMMPGDAELLKEVYNSLNKK